MAFKIPDDGFKEGVKKAKPVLLSLS